MASGWDEVLLVFVNACTWCCCDLDSHGVCLCCGRFNLTDRRSSALVLRPNPSTIEVRGAPVVSAPAPLPPSAVLARSQPRVTRCPRSACGGSILEMGEGRRCILCGRAPERLAKSR
jgi:hypothetical protein